jgi:hypothetical protein
MADYARAAAELKARLDAKYKRAADLDTFFEELRTCVQSEVNAANDELKAHGAPIVMVREESIGEPTMELTCDRAVCQISQDREKPSVGALMKGEKGETIVTFVIAVDESPVTAQRLSLAPSVEAKAGPREIAAAFVEALIDGAPGVV